MTFGGCQCSLPLGGSSAAHVVVLSVVMLALALATTASASHSACYINPPTSAPEPTPEQLRSVHDLQFGYYLIPISWRQACGLDEAATRASFERMWADAGCGLESDLVQRDAETLNQYLTAAPDRIAVTPCEGEREYSRDWRRFCKAVGKMNLGSKTPEDLAVSDKAYEAADALMQRAIRKGCFEDG